MRRILMVLTVAAVMAAMMVVIALPGFAAPKAGAGCKGLMNAIAKQTENRPEKGPNPKLVQKANERGCVTSPPAEEE